MKLVLLVAGLVVCAASVMVLAAPGRTHGLVRSMTGTRRRLWGLGKVCWGPAIFWAAGASTAPWLPQLLGSIELIKGLLLLVMPDRFFQRMAAWVQGQSPAAHRLWGLIGLVIGVALLATVRQGGGFLILL